jgi:cysteinyl-tRNA synthetase
LGHGTVVTLLPDGGERYLSTSLFASEVVPEPLRFYNTLTAKVEQLEPVKPGKVSIYSCGPSLDGPPDLGLCRRVVFSDVLRRYLECRGYDVKHAMNLGDIDDRTVNECLKAGAKLRDFTARWEANFFQALETLRVTRAHHYPRASDHVNEMVEQTRGLLDKGLAYEKLRSIYYRISSFPDYGKLSGVELDQVRRASSTTYDYYEKDHPGDFALFKRPSLAELKAGIFWQTPWGKTRPGWHIECSCMAVRYLGQPIDIHTASTDLTFPHGDNEIAIAAGLSGKPLANLWMHSEVVMAEGRKVSRAAGNDLSLDDVLKLGFDGPTVRYWLLATHYRTVLNYSAGELERAKQCVTRLNEFVDRLRHFQAGRRSPDLDQTLYEAHTGWQESLDHDLSISTALGKLFGLVRLVNRLLNDGELDADQVQQVLGFMRQANQILAVIDFEPEQRDAQVERLIAARNQARQAKDFARADALRVELQALGVQLADSPSGTRWKRA